MTMNVASIRWVVLNIVSNALNDPTLLAKFKSCRIATTVIRHRGRKLIRCTDCSSPITLPTDQGSFEEARCNSVLQLTVLVMSTYDLLANAVHHLDHALATSLLESGLYL